MSDIILDGPYSDGTSPGTVLLYSGEESDTTRKTKPNQETVPGDDEEDSLLTPLSGSEDVSFSGQVVDINAQSEYGGTSVEALQEWVFNFESLCLAQQGSGYALTNPVEGITYDPASDTGVLVEDTEWTVEGGRPTVVSWNIELKVSSGVQGVEDRLQYVTDQKNRQTSISEDKFVVNGTNVPLGDVESKSRSRSVDINSTEILSGFSEDLPSVGTVESGVEGKFTFQGQLTSNDGNTDELARVYNRDLHGKSVEFYDSFSNRVFEGAVSQTNTSESAGRVDVVDYRVTFLVGDSLL